MSLAIDIDRVTGVLLSDGWHRTLEGTFCLDSYEFLRIQQHSDKDQVLFGGGQSPLISAMGAAWKNVGGEWIACPLSAILAVRYRAERQDEIDEPMSVVEVIGGYVELKKHGKKYVGLCPFHREDTPSFTVDPKRGRFHCLGCQATGTVEDFLGRIEPDSSRN